jgi:hypothetical protein
MSPGFTAENAESAEKGLSEPLLGVLGDLSGETAFTNPPERTQRADLRPRALTGSQTGIALT